MLKKKKLVLWYSTKALICISIKALWILGKVKAETVLEHDQMQALSSPFALLTLNQRQYKKQQTVAQQGCSEKSYFRGAFKFPLEVWFRVKVTLSHRLDKFTPLTLHLNFTAAPQGAIRNSGCLYPWCMCFLLCFLSEQTDSIKSLPFLRMRHIWQEFCNAGPEPALSKTFLFPGVQHHKLNYCLYHHQRHHRMLLEGKPALGWSVKSWKTKRMCECGVFLYLWICCHFNKCGNHIFS